MASGGPVPLGRCRRWHGALGGPAEIRPRTLPLACSSLSRMFGKPLPIAAPETRVRPWVGIVGDDVPWLW